MNAIFLTGFMAAGKSAVGRLLAERLRRPFLDTDAEIERDAGMPISSIFRDRGETEFRRLEGLAIRRAAEVEGAIVATGGGAPTIAENRRRMREAGTIVRLAAAPDEILSRIGDGSDRPLLAGAVDRMARIRELLAAREAAYADADVTIETTGASPETVVERILASLAGRSACGEGRP